MTKKPTKPENLTQVAKDDPMRLFMDAQIQGPSESIEISEARGQRQLVASDSIPTHWHNDSEANDAILRQLGFELGKPFDDDPLFRPAILPKGWTKDATSHAMHSNICDAQGRERVGVFFKAAFYDRRADLWLKLCVQGGYDPRVDLGTSARVVWARGKGEEMIILQTFACTEEEMKMERWERSTPLEARVTAWLEEHYPEWQDPMAYWDRSFKGEVVVPK